jgi:hypothetical protein
MIKTSATAFAAELGVKLSLLLPAALGGLIALQFVDDPLDEQACKPCRKAVVFVTGTGLGIFCGPLPVAAFNLSDNQGRLEMGFAVIIAAGGLAVLANAVKALRSTNWGAAIESWITRR